MEKLVNENINKYLYGPSEEEIEKRIEKSNLNPNNLLLKSAKHEVLMGVKKALKIGIDDAFIKEGALGKAAANGHLDIVKYLAENGVKINRNALNLAVLYENTEILKYLFDKILIKDKQHIRYLYNMAKINNNDDTMDFIKNYAIENNIRIGV